MKIGMVNMKLWSRLDYAMLVFAVLGRLRVRRFDRSSAEDLYFTRRRITS